MQMYEVEAIVGKRMNPQTNILEYEVKWFSYPSQQNTWQPEKNLVFVKNLIRQYNQKAQIHGDNFLAQKNQNPPKLVQKKSLQEIVENQDESDNEELQANIFFQEESQNELNKQKNDPFNKLNQGKSNNMKQSLRNKKPPEPPKPNKVIAKKQEENQLSKRPMVKPMPKQVQQKSITKQILDREQTQLYKNFHRRRQGPPPLPPDFAVNKTKYIDPIISRKPCYTQMPFKHKIIEKERYREEKKKIHLLNPPIQKYQQPNHRQQNLRNSLQNKNYHKPPSKLIPPPPPPPPFLAPRHQPIVQQNYFSNQYQVYNPNISASIVQRPHQLNSTFSVPSAQYSYTSEHAYQYDYTGQRSIDRNPNKYEKQGEINEESLQVLKVLNMEKRREGYFYYAQTNFGQMWLDRSQVVPAFSTALVLFYQQYLTFQG